MLVIRMQRTGRKGHAQFRVVVQDSRRTPTSGKVVASLGSYNPHTKTTTLDKEKASFYLEHGAQPTERVVRMLKAEGVKLPSWVSESSKKEGKLKNPEKLRKNRPAEPEAEATEEAPVEDAPAAEANDEGASEEAAAEPEASPATEAAEPEEKPAE